MVGSVEIIWFTVSPKSTGEAEKRIAELLSRGWRIAGAGGGGNQTESGCLVARSVSTGFVVMQRGDIAS